MRTRSVLLVLALVAVACGTATEATTTTEQEPTTPEPTTTTTVPVTTTTEAAATTTEAAAPSGPQFVLTTISFGAGSSVVITNIGDETGNLAGHFLCQRPSYYGFPDVEVPAGQSVAISTGGNVFVPPPGAIVIDDTATIGALNAAGGEVGLYSSANFGSSSAILSYVEWGSAGHGRSDVAVQAGIWSGFVQTTGDSAVISANTAPAMRASQWDVG